MLKVKILMAAAAVGMLFAAGCKGGGSDVPLKAETAPPGAAAMGAKATAAPGAQPAQSGQTSGQGAAPTAQ